MYAHCVGWLQLIDNKSLYKHLKIIVNGLRTDSTPCAIEIVTDFLAFPLSGRTDEVKKSRRR